MSITVALAPSDTLAYPAAGHLWVYLNWALGLRALGCDVVWLETVDHRVPLEMVSRQLETLTARLRPYGLAHRVVLTSATDEELPASATSGRPSLEAALGADLLINFRYDMTSGRLRRFRRSALVDIDPGLLQIWVATGQISLGAHDVYFTIGETVARSHQFPDLGLPWHHVPPSVALEHWPVRPPPADAAFTTVSHWYGEEWVQYRDELYRNDKRSGFEQFLELPSFVQQPLELALHLGAEEDAEGHEERRALQDLGWRVRDALTVTATPEDYQRYIQGSLAEFSCAKPSYVRFQNAWVSDRTVCYLASGKPAVVQDTGPSRFLPDAAGLYRFRDLEGAVRSLEAVVSDYERQSRLARALAEEHFDARKVVARVLEIALS